jgi:tRNA A37 N6-isopentenylltransferase MiaA
MFELGVAEEARRALAGPLSPTAAKVLGLHEAAAGDEQALVAQTLRLARYQRKWMRRIPGLVTVDADRPPEEIADAVLALARARERLPADRAG